MEIKKDTQRQESVRKILVGPHGRIVGGVIVALGTAAPDGFSLIDPDPSAKIGQLVVKGKPVTKKGREYVANIINSKGTVINRIVVNSSDEPAIPKGYKIKEQKNG